MPQADLAVALRGVVAVVVEAPQAVVAVDLAAHGARGLAHPGGGELPVVAGVERGGVEHQDRHLVGAPPVVVLGRESLAFAHRLHLEIVQPDLLVALAQDLGVDLPLVQLSRPHRARVVRLEQHLEVGRPLGGHPGADVALHARDELVLELVDDADVVVPRDRAVRILLQQLADLQVVVGAEDRAPRDAGEDLDAAQGVVLRQPGEHADVEQRGAEAAAGERQADLAPEHRLQGVGVAAQEDAERLPGGAVRIVAVLEAGETGELAGGGLPLPIGDVRQRGRPREPTGGLLVVLEPEVRFADGHQEPPESPLLIFQGRQLLHEAAADRLRLLAPRRRARRGAPRRPRLLVFLVGQQVQHESGIDTVVPAVGVGIGRVAGLVAAAVIEHGALQVGALVVELPPALVDGARQSQRLLVAGRGEGPRPRAGSRAPGRAAGPAAGRDPCRCRARAPGRACGGARRSGWTSDPAAPGSGPCGRTRTPVPA